MTALDAAELQALLGPETGRWHELGITVQTGTPRDPDAHDQVTVRLGEEIIGFTTWCETFPHRREFRALVAEGRGSVAFPAGFMPPDPVRAQRMEQQRWFPNGSPQAGGAR